MKAHSSGGVTQIFSVVLADPHPGHNWGFELAFHPHSKFSYGFTNVINRLLLLSLDAGAHKNASSCKQTPALPTDLFTHRETDARMIVNRRRANRAGKILASYNSSSSSSRRRRAVHFSQIRNI